MKKIIVIEMDVQRDSTLLDARPHETEHDTPGNPARVHVVPSERAALRSDDARRAAHLAAAYAPPPQRLSELDSAQREVAQVQLTAPRQIAFPSEGSRTRTSFSRPATAAQAGPQQRRQALHVVG